MKRIILILVIAAVAAVVTIKLIRNGRQATQTPAVSPQTQPFASTQRVFYLFHDSSDQDAGCRRIYAFADRAEKELPGKVEVRRPDIGREKTLLTQYQVRVLPTILILSPNGSVEERFEGEGEQTAQRLEQTLQRLRTSSE